MVLPYLVEGGLNEMKEMIDVEIYAREKGWAYPPLPPFMHRQRRVEDKHSFLVLIFNQPLQVWGQWERPTVTLPPPIPVPPTPDCLS